MRVIKLKKLKAIYPYYVLCGFLLLFLYQSASAEVNNNQPLINHAKQQEQQLIDRFGRLQHVPWQAKCDALVVALALKQFKQCVLLNAEFANAYAFAHGHVLLTKGLLKNINNDDQLAHILAHEHAHLTLNHFQQAQDLTNNPPVFFTKSRIKKFYRSIEKEADVAADLWLSQHGRDPLQVQHYLLRIKNSATEKSADHAKLKDRIKQATLPLEIKQTFWSRRFTDVSQ